MPAPRLSSSSSSVRIIALYVALTAGCAAALEKHWLPDLEWQTASNWADGRVPDTDSRVIFPRQTRHAVGIGAADLQLSGVHLPRQGSLLLPRDGKLQLTDSRASARTTRWSKEGNLFWADPANWNGSSIAAPHLERVPCRRDDVVLPSANRALSVLLPVRQIEVRSVRQSNEHEPFTKWEWQSFRDRREFSRGRFTVKYTEYSCPECSCQRESQSDYLEEICAIERPRCGFIGCEYPLTVEGHCCPYCGGRVFTSKKPVSLAIVRATADDALDRYAAKLAWHVRRTWHGRVEVLVKPKRDYSAITIDEAVENLREMLHRTGIDVAGTETAGAAMKESRLAVTLGPLLGTPFLLIALFLLVFLYFGYSLEHVLSGCMEAVSSVRDGIRADKQKHGFARFENVPEGNVQIADASPGTSGRTADNDIEEIAHTVGGRFENPLYRSKRDRAEEHKILEVDAPLSLVTLKSKMDDQLDSEEMDTEE